MEPEEQQCLCTLPVYCCRLMSSLLFFFHFSLDAQQSWIIFWPFLRTNWGVIGLEVNSTMDSEEKEEQFFTYPVVCKSISSLLFFFFFCNFFRCSVLFPLHCSASKLNIFSSNVHLLCWLVLQKMSIFSDWEVSFLWHEPYQKVLSGCLEILFSSLKVPLSTMISVTTEQNKKFSKYLEPSINTV